MVEFQALDPDDGAAAAFLGVPWELLAGEAGHLAADFRLRYCPVRRLGGAGSPPPPSDFRLGLTFMAASPRGVQELNYEGEETAILDATGTIGLDLTVEESGNPDRLAERLAELTEMQALHLSCHGRSEPAPVLLLEDEVGGRLPTTAEGLVDALHSNLPRLLFLSACQTAAAGSLADPMVTSMVRAGLPAVLGWDGSVYDHEATAFARELYESLSRRGTLEEAAGAARRALLNAQGPRPARDWHLARLWLGAEGGGALVSGKNKRRRMIGREHGVKEFLDARRRASPVAGRDAFVGRRRELQAALGALRRDGEWPGVLIRGMGRLGKSSLAARIAHRRPDLAPAVVYGTYDAVSVADAIRDACPPAAKSIEAEREALLKSPERLEGLLREVLEAPCQQAGDGRPVLLVIDDLEQILEAPAPGGRHRVKADQAPVLRAVLRAFDPARTDSRLLLTSRFAFTLPDGGEELGDRLYDLQLPPMDAAAARKQALRREQAHGATPADDAAKAKRLQELFGRCVAVAQGNPGLQDKLFDLALEAPDEAARALDEMEDYLAGGELPEQQAVNEFLENLAIGKLVGLLSDGERALLRAATLFELPVPLEVLEKLREAVGGDVGRLLALGLCDRFEDVVAPPRPAAAVNALARPQAGELAEDDARTLAGLVLDGLFGLWGGADGRGRPFPADAELTRLALACDNAPVVAACAAGALYWLDQEFAYRRAAATAQRAVAILDGAGVELPLHLLRLAGEACVRVGEPEPARTYYDRALKRIETARAADETVDEAVWSTLLVAQARLLGARGEPDRAIRLYEQARSLDERTGDERHAALTMGESARLRAARGEVDEALRLHGERLQVMRGIGDLSEQAAALWDMAQIELGRGEVGKAVPMVVEAYQIVDRIGRLEGICTVGVLYGQILIASDQREEGLAVLRRSEAGFRRMQRGGEAEQVAALIRRIEDG